MKMLQVVVEIIYIHLNINVQNNFNKSLNVSIKHKNIKHKNITRKIMATISYTYLEELSVFAIQSVVGFKLLGEPVAYLHPSLQSPPKASPPCFTWSDELERCLIPLLLLRAYHN